MPLGARSKRRGRKARTTVLDEWRGKRRCSSGRVNFEIGRGRAANACSKIIMVRETDYDMSRLRWRQSNIGNRIQCIGCRTATKDSHARIRQKNSGISGERAAVAPLIGEDDMRILRPCRALGRADRKTQVTGCT